MTTTYEKGQIAATAHSSAASAIGYAESIAAKWRANSADGDEIPADVMAAIDKATAASEKAVALDLAFNAPTAENTASEAAMLHSLRAHGLRQRKQANVLKRYRDDYVAATAYSGKASLNNGDTVASALEGASPEQVMAAAEILLGMDEGELVTKYGHLNPGQQRMNSGNRIRNAVKKGIIAASDVEEAINYVAAA